MVVDRGMWARMKLFKISFTSPILYHGFLLVSPCFGGLSFAAIFSYAICWLSTFSLEHSCNDRDKAWRISGDVPIIYVISWSHSMPIALKAV